MSAAVDTKIKRGDVRKLLRIALAMEDLQSPTLNNLARETGIHKQCLLDDINRMQAQLGMTITKVDFFYKLTHWGPILKPEAVRSFLNEADA